MPFDFLNMINKLEPITLMEMDSVSLLDRTDTKFIFHIDKLKEILQETAENYKVLEVKGNRYSNYDTNYFDTDNFQLYYNHHNR